MFCVNCGKQLAEGVKFCSSCGAQQVQQPQQVQRPQVQASVCVKCGRKYLPGEAFCVGCGTARNAAAQPAQYSQPAQPQYNPYAAGQYRPAVNYAAVQPNNISGGIRFLAILPLILVVLPMLINFIDFFTYYPFGERYIIRFFEANAFPFILSMIVPVICLINGVMSKPSKGGCIVGGVFGILFLFVQLIFNACIILRIDAVFYIGDMLSYQLINGSEVFELLRLIARRGIDSIRPIYLLDLLYPIKNIIAVIAMFVLASKADK